MFREIRRLKTGATTRYSKMVSVTLGVLLGAARAAARRAPVSIMLAVDARIVPRRGPAVEARPGEPPQTRRTHT
jgi:hypothetical protein